MKFIQLTPDNLVEEQTVAHVYVVMTITQVSQIHCVSKNVPPLNCL